MIKFNWMFFHRWLGLLTCVGVLLWGVSGISHPIMTRLQPKPVAFAAPSVHFDLNGAVAIKQVLSQYHIEQFAHVSLAQFAGESYFRVYARAAQPARYFNVKSGEELIGGDLQYAKILAAHFTGNDIAQITKAELITQFSDDYHAVNRLLPVWRVEFAGNQHLRAFIDTEQSRLSTLVDDTRYRLTQLFEFGHNWSFLAATPRLQLSISAVVLFTILLSAISGIYLYFKLANHKQRLAKQPLKRWHRRIGLLISFAALIFASSGLFHLVMSYQQQKEILVAKTEQISPHQIDDSVWQYLTTKPLAKLDLIAHAGRVYWYVLEASSTGENQMPVAQVAALAKEAEHPEHHDHHAHASAVAKPVLPYVLHADTNQQDKFGEDKKSSVEALAKLQAVAIAKRSKSEVVSTEWVTKFANEYGFIFKRLPVIKVQMNDAEHTRYYIEPATGALSVKVRNIDGLEGFVFAYLHKWSFQSLNKDLRDILVGLFALSNIVVAMLGFYLFAKRYA